MPKNLTGIEHAAQALSTERQRAAFEVRTTEVAWTIRPPHGGHQRTLRVPNPARRTGDDWVVESFTLAVGLLLSALLMAVFKERASVVVTFAIFSAALFGVGALLAHRAGQRGTGRSVRVPEAVANAHTTMLGIATVTKSTEFPSAITDYLYDARKFTDRVVAHAHALHVQGLSHSAPAVEAAEQAVLVAARCSALVDTWLDVTSTRTEAIARVQTVTLLGRAPTKDDEEAAVVAALGGRDDHPTNP